MLFLNHIHFKSLLGASLFMNGLCYLYLRLGKCPIHYNKQGKLSLKSFFLFLLTVNFTLPTTAQTYDFKPVHTPQNVIVNQKIPESVLAPDEVMRANFSKEPTD